MRMAAIEASMIKASLLKSADGLKGCLVGWLRIQGYFFFEEHLGTDWFLCWCHFTQVVLAWLPAGSKGKGLDD